MPPVTHPIPSISPFSEAEPAALGGMSPRFRFRTRLDSLERSPLCSGLSPADRILIGKRAELCLTR